LNVLLDTSAVIRLFEMARQDVIDAVVAQGGKFAFSLISVGELHRGVAQAHTPEIAAMRSETISMALRRGHVLTPNEDTAKIWGTLAARMPRRVRANDLWIAATALETHMTLVSSDADLLSVVDGHPTLLIES